MRKLSVLVMVVGMMLATPVGVAQAADELVYDQWYSPNNGGMAVYGAYDVPFVLDSSGRLARIEVALVTRTGVDLALEVRSEDGATLVARSTAVPTEDGDPGYSFPPETVSFAFDGVHLEAGTRYQARLIVSGLRQGEWVHWQFAPPSYALRVYLHTDGRPDLSHCRDGAWKAQGFRNQGQCAAATVR